MAYLTFSSTNPNFSYILGKRPTSGMQVKSNRAGRFFGWFDPRDDKTYHVFFKDSDIEVSYKADLDEQFEFVNTSRYNSALIPLNAIVDFFHTAAKKVHEMDAAGFSNTCVISMMFAKSERILANFADKISGFELSYEHVAHKNYQITISTNKTFHELLNYVNLLCLYLGLKNEADYFVVDDNIVDKYLKCLTVLDPPYYIRYLFKVYFLSSPRRFNKYKDLLEKTSQHQSVALTYGDNKSDRMTQIKSLLGTQDHVLDIGCGHGSYMLMFAPKMLADKAYIAVDIDEDCRLAVEGKAKCRNYDQVVVLDSVKAAMEYIDSNVDNTPVNVILTEVIEHMSIEEAGALIATIIGGVKNLDKLIITTPNADFNKFYDDADGFSRHPDHKFEFTKSQFIEFIAHFGSIDTKLMDMGDKVDGIPTTLGAVISGGHNK